MSNPSASRIAVVTGGGTGAGQAIAVGLAQAGFQVHVLGRRLEKLKETAALASNILPAACDVADRAQVNAVLGEIGTIDLLVNSAGLNIRNRTLAEIDPADWDKLIAVNATGAFNTIRAVLPGMRENGGGLIVNVSSVAGKRAIPLAGAAYNASKFAMTALGVTTGLEEADNMIRVTNIYPGEINTPILDERPVPVSDEHKARILQPEDIAKVVVMLTELPPRANIPELVIKPTSQPWA